jgi:dienelactone hydrolase
VPTLILTGEKDEWCPPKHCQNLHDNNLTVVVYPGATHAFASPGLDGTYLGHRIAYQKEAADDAQRRALVMIKALSK